VNINGILECKFLTKNVHRTSPPWVVVAVVAGVMVVVGGGLPLLDV
jgi:hypothetical protein